VNLTKFNATPILQGIDNYKTYLQLCESIGDINGQVVALNSIGVNYIHLACPETDMGILKAIPTNLDYIQNAIEYHERHLQISDNGGILSLIINYTSTNNRVYLRSVYSQHKSWALLWITS
jgi:hypothetical protein